MVSISENYVSFETAKLLKEKGFTQKCPHYYLNGQIFKHCYQEVIPKNKEIVECPTQAIVMKWLREAHNIDIIAPPQFDSIKWTYSAIIFTLSIPCTEIRLNDNKDKKEEAVEVAIRYCLENII